MSTISECDQRLDAIAAQKALLERQLTVELEEKELSILQWKLDTERASRSTKRKRQRSDNSDSDDFQHMRPPAATRRKRAPSSLLNLLCGQGQERYFPIFDRLAGFLDISAVVALTRTCKRLSGVYQSLLPLQWNVNQRLARFVQSPERFRHALGKSGALISGSFALQFFERVVWEDADLDIFVEDGRGAAEMVQYIEEEEGYGCAKHVALGRDLPHQYLRQTRIYKKQAPDGRWMRIEVLITSTLPLRAILMTCYTTAHANILSWNKGYSLFPKITFDDDKMVLAKHLDDRLGSMLARYSARGWRSTERLANLSDVSQDLMFQRRVGDSSSWIIPLDTTGVAHPGLPDHVLEYSGFTLNASSHPGFASNQQFSFEASVFASCVLRYRYTSGEDGWNRFLERRTAPLATVELCKMKKEARPRNTLPVIVGEESPEESYYTEEQDHWPAFSAEFEKPEGWEFADHLIPRWREEWSTEWHEFISGQFGSDDGEIEEEDGEEEDAD